VVLTCKECGANFKVKTWPPSPECPLCGATLDGYYECVECGRKYNRNAVELATTKKPLDKETSLRNLMKIPGVGKLKAEALYNAGFHTISQIGAASVEDLAAVPKIGKKSAQKIKEALSREDIKALEEKEFSESFIEEEMECPVCGTILSAYDTECYECGYRLVKEGGKQEDLKALAVYNKKLEVNPKDVDVLFAKGALLSRMGRHEEALECFQRVAELDPNFEGIWNAMAEAYTSLGMHDKAAECYRKSMEQALGEILPGIAAGEKEAEKAAGEGFEDELLRSLLGGEEEVPEEEIEELEMLTLTPHKPPVPAARPTGTPPEEEGDIEDMLESLLEGFEEEEIAEEEAPGEAVEVVEEYFECPLCGTIVEADATECPKCHAKFIPEAERAEEISGGEEIAEELPAEELDLLSELEELSSVFEEELAVAEEAGATVPEEKVVVAAEKPTPIERKPPVKAPRPEPTVSAGARREKPAVPPARRELMRPGAKTPSIKKPPAPRKGMVNGLVTKRKPLAPREGLINGGGKRRTRKIEPPGILLGLKREKDLFIYKIVMLIIVVLLLSSGISLLSIHIPEKAEPIVVDGNIGDWGAIHTYVAEDPSGDAYDGADIVEAQYYMNAAYLFLRVQSSGDMFSSGRMGVVYVFFDSDSTPSTGYAVSGMGADLLAKIVGDDTGVRYTVLYKYDRAYKYNGLRDRDDWNGWVRAGAFEAAIKGKSLETKLPRDLFETEKPWVFITSRLEDVDRVVSTDSVFPFTSGGGGCLFTYNTASYPENVVPESSEAILARGTMFPENAYTRISTVYVRYMGSIERDDVALSSIRLYIGGESYSPAEIGEGTITFTTDAEITSETDVSITAVFPSALREKTVCVSFVSVDAVDADGNTIPVYVEPPETPTFLAIGRLPSQMAVDGFFGEWTSSANNIFRTEDSDEEAVGDPNVDILYTDVAPMNDTVFIHTHVSGNILAGTMVADSLNFPQQPPSQPQPSGGGGGGGTGGGQVTTVYLPAREGRDVFKASIVFLDGTTYVVECSGKNGVIEETTVTYKGQKVDVPVEVLASHGDVELSLNLSDSPHGTVFKVYIETSSWMGASDSLGPTENILLASPGDNSPVRWVGTRADIPLFSTEVVVVLPVAVLFMVAGRKRFKRREHGFSWTRKGE